jgi:hypothetical protein
MKDKNHIIISIDTEKAFDNSAFLHYKKKQEKLCIEKICFKIIKSIHEKPMAYIILKEETLK